MHHVLVSVIITATGFQPSLLRSAAFAPKGSSANSAAAFAKEVLAPLGAVAYSRQSDSPLWDRVERRIRFKGVQMILGVRCEGTAFVVNSADTVEPRLEIVGDGFWGCIINAEESHGLPAGTEAQFSLSDGLLHQLIAPTGRTLTSGQFSCSKLVFFQNGDISECVLSSSRRIRGIDFPQGTRLRFEPGGQVIDAFVFGKVADGHAWDDAYVSCGGLYFWLDKNGEWQLPRPDPNHEACCD